MLEPVLGIIKSNTVTICMHIYVHILYKKITNIGKMSQNSIAHQETGLIFISMEKQFAL